MMSTHTVDEVIVNSFDDSLIMTFILDLSHHLGDVLGYEIIFHKIDIFRFDQKEMFLVKRLVQRKLLIDFVVNHVGKTLDSFI